MTNFRNKLINSDYMQSRKRRKKTDSQNEFFECIKPWGED